MAVKNARTMKKTQPGKIVPINRIGKTEKYILVPRLERKRVVKKVKRLIKVKGECYFTLGVPLSLIDFIYRTVVKLGLRDRRLIFSRGSVKINSRPTSTVVEVHELDWDLGTSIIIPMKRKYTTTLAFNVGGKKHTVRLMEIMVLSGLLKLIFKDKSEKWRSAKAVTIIVQGWGALNQENPPDISRADA